MQKFEERLFIAGKFVEGSGEKIAVVNPATKEQVALVHTAGAKEVDEAVDAAEKAWPAWANGNPTIRASVLNKLADLIELNADALAEAQTTEMGKPLSQAKAQDVSLCAKTFRYYAGLADKVHGMTSLNVPGFFSVEIKQPYGVTAGIIPWNGPLVMLAWKAAPALAAGNASIIKPSEKSPISALVLAGLFKEAGVPDGILSILNGARETGELLASHMRIRKIAFTGSAPAGRAVAQAAARSNLKVCNLELGGKSPAIIFDDCNIKDALAWVQAGFNSNSGQVCIANSRVYVQDTIFDEFAKQLKINLESHAVGDPLDQKTASGPQVDDIQYKKVMQYIETGKKEGQLLTGGISGGDKGFFVKPTVFVDVQDQAIVNREEIFGPVAILHRFSSEDEVLKKANDTEYGLAASVFTQSVTRAIKCAKALEAGTIGVNCTTMLDIDLGFGGWKSSGIGRECGSHGLENYLEVKTIFMR